MADLRAVYRSGDNGGILPLVIGLAVLLAGLALLTIGVARVGSSVLVDIGVPPAGASQIAFVTAGTIPPVVLAVTLTTVTDVERTRLVGLAGVLLSLAGIAIGLPFRFATIAPVVGLVYAIGVFVVMFAIVTGVTGTERDSRDRDSRWDRSGAVDMFRAPESNRIPADGGDEDSDLSFLLDEEE
ncbi:MAG: hypothetical protein ABEJ58_01925 [Halodesulfurarchaeum sp.]